MLIEVNMAVSTTDWIAALETACRAESDGVERAERAGNGIATTINRQRLDLAQERLSAAIEAIQN